MAQLPLKFNTTGNNQGLDDYTPLPAGDYVVAITKSEYRATKAKTGHYLRLVLKVATGPNKGRVLFENLNLDNPNAIAVEIANKALNSICQACDKVGVEDSSELHGIPMVVTLAVTPANATNPPSNSVKAYKKNTGELVDNPAAGVVAETATEPAGDTAVKKKLPWDK